jgi:phage shock protein E
MSVVVDKDQVVSLVEKGARLVEVLPRKEYERNHIRGAINIPLRRLAAEAEHLDRQQPIIVYCWDYL